jgi:hypothetical protein
VDTKVVNVLVVCDLLARRKNHINSSHRRPNPRPLAGGINRLGAAACREVAFKGFEKRDGNHPVWHWNFKSTSYAGQGPNSYLQSQKFGVDKLLGLPNQVGDWC